MSGTCVPQNVFVEVDKNVRAGDIVLLKFSAERAIQSSENAHGIADVLRLPGESDFQHGSDQRCRDTVPGDVSDQDAKMFFVVEEEIIEVSGNRAHGHIACRDFQSVKFRNILGKRGGLNGASNFQFLMKSEQPFFGSQRAMRDDIAEAADEDQKAEEFESGAEDVQQAKTGKVGLEDEKKPEQES